MRATGISALAEAAGRAPDAPGVYFMLDANRMVVYIGKAGSVRRRLQQHAKAAATSASARDWRRGRVVADVRWELWPTEDAAAAREADLVVAFRPPLNASLTRDGRWVYVILDGHADGATTLRLAPEPAAARATFGCFPHLGIGVSSQAAIACSEGYASFVRLLWAATAPDDRAPVPSGMAGVSPPAEARLGSLGGFRPGVERLLRGTGAEILVALHEASLDLRPAYMQPALRRDAEQADAFFRYGPRAIHRLRRRHGLRAQAVSRGQLTSMLAREIRDAIGDVRLPAAM